MNEIEETYLTLVSATLQHSQQKLSDEDFINMIEALFHDLTIDDFQELSIYLTEFTVHLLKELARSSEVEVNELYSFIAIAKAKSKIELE